VEQEVSGAVLLHDTLAGDMGVRQIVNDRVFDRIVPPGTADPYVLFQRTSVLPEYTFDGEADIGSSMFQIECWGKDPDEVARLALAVRDALAGLDAFRESTMDDFSQAAEGSDAHDFVTRMDYEILHEVNV
jgi:hypothetical protein